MSVETLAADVVVVGAGLAGITAAHFAAKSGKSVLVLKKPGASASFYRMSATRGYQLPLDDHEEEEFYNDILTAGEGLTVLALVEALVRNSKEGFSLLTKAGVKFESKGGELMRVPGCFSEFSRAAVIGDVEQCAEACKTLIPDIKQVEAEAVKLVVIKNKVVGLVAVARNGTVFGVSAGAVVLASGGGGGVFEATLVPKSHIGTAAVMCDELGAKPQGLEFFQIMLAYEKVGALDFFVKDFFPKITAIRSRSGRNVLGKITNAPAALKKRSTHFPFTTSDGSHVVDGEIALLAERGGAVVVVDDVEYNVKYAAHSFNGGILTDAGCRVPKVEGLFVCGEAATGMHGANRVGGAMVPACVVFGKIAGEGAAEFRCESNPQVEKDAQPYCATSESGIVDGEIENFRKMLREVMQSKMLVLRSRTELEQTLRICSVVEGVFLLPDELAKGVKGRQPKSPDVRYKFLETRTMAKFARLVVESALARKESLGPHYVTQ